MIALKITSMALLRNQRSRKRIRIKFKQKKLSLFFFASTFFLFLIVLFNFFGVYDDSESFNMLLSRRRLKYCTETCNEVSTFRANEVETSYAGSLEFSAVDSFFSYRVSDSKLKDVREDKDSVISTFFKFQNNNDDTIRDYFLKNLSHKPTYLPPLLERLIEAVSLNLKTEIEPRPPIKTIRFNRKGFDIEISLNNKGLHKIKGGSRDSIAIATIATATAFFFDSGRRNSSLRMTVLNHDWDESLRRIAGWDYEHESRNNSHKILDEIFAKNFISDFQMRQRQLQGLSRKSLSGIEFINFSHKRGLIFEVCIDECIGNNGERLINNLIHGVNKNEKKVNEMKTSFILFRSYPTARKIFTGVFSVIMSTTVLWGHRRIIKCWKHITYISSVRMLLEEEYPIAERHKGFTRHESKISGRKNGYRKGRRRKTLSKINRDDSSTNELKSGVKTMIVNSCKPEVVKHNDNSVMSDQTPDQLNDKDGKDTKNLLPSFVDDSSEEYTIKSYTSSASSNTISDDRTNNISTQWATIKKSSIPSEKMPMILKCLDTSNCCTEATANHNLKSSWKNPSSSDTSEGKSSCRNKSFINSKAIDFSRTFAPMISCDSMMYLQSGLHPVPTENQREVAAHQLRQFQKTQIQRLLNQRMASKGYSPSRDSSHARHFSKLSPEYSSNYISTHSFSSSSSLVGNDLFNGRPHLYGKFKDNNLKKNDRCQSNFSLLKERPLSNILEEEEEEIMFNTGSSSTASLENLNNSENTLLCTNKPKKSSSIAHIHIPLTDSPTSVSESTAFSSVNLWSPFSKGEANVTHFKREQSVYRSVALGNLPTAGSSTSTPEAVMLSSLDPWSQFPKKTSGDVVRKEINLVDNENDLVISPYDGSNIRNKIDFEVDSINCSDANICLKVSAKVFSPSWESTVTKPRRSIW